MRLPAASPWLIHLTWLLFGALNFYSTTFIRLINGFTTSSAAGRKNPQDDHVMNYLVGVLRIPQLASSLAETQG